MPNLSETDLSNLSRPHGQEQQLKMELLNMIHSAENPFDIICHVARQLEADSGEPGYAQYVEEQLRAVYGFALQHKKLLTDELHDVEKRLKIIEERNKNGDFTEEEHTRIGFAIDRHKKNIERLKTMIQKAEADGTSLYFDK